MKKSDIVRLSNFPGLSLRIILTAALFLLCLPNKLPANDSSMGELKAIVRADPKPGEHARNWNLMNRLNQKGVRPQDKPIPIEQLNADEQAAIMHQYPELINEISDNKETAMATKIEGSRNHKIKSWQFKLNLVRLLASKGQNYVL